MFIETITQPGDEWHNWNERLAMHSEPPAALVASIAWNAGDDKITTVNVSDTPGAISDFYMERVRSLVQAEGEPTSKPQRHGEPVAIYIRTA